MTHTYQTLFGNLRVNKRRHGAGGKMDTQKIAESCNYQHILRQAADDIPMLRPGRPPNRSRQAATDARAPLQPSQFAVGAPFQGVPVVFFGFPTATVVQDIEKLRFNWDPASTPIFKSFLLMALHMSDPNGNPDLESPAQYPMPEMSSEQWTMFFDPGINNQSQTYTYGENTPGFPPPFSPPVVPQTAEQRIVLSMMQQFKLPVNAESFQSAMEYLKTVTPVALGDVAPHTSSVNREMAQAQYEMATLRQELARIRSETDITRREQIATAAEAARARAEADAAEAKPPRLDRQIVKSVHEMMLQMLGMVADPTVVPGPYRPGDEVRYEDAAKTVPLFLFEWDEPANSVHNADGIQQLVNAVTANQIAAPTWENLGSPVALRAAITRSAVYYFGTKAKCFKAQGSAELARKAEERAHATMIRNRKRRKACGRRKFVPAFKLRYTEAATVGVEALLVTDAMSEDHSDYGEISEERWIGRALAFTRDEGALETEIIRARSKPLHKILIRLDKFERDANPPDNVSTGRVGQRKKKKKKIGNEKTKRFPGFAENANEGLPKQTGRGLPYEFSVDKEWRKNNRTHVRQNPVEFTIFDLVIPDTDFDNIDLGFLADDEDEADN
ncbi:hypothetical protein C8R47DRAFT_1067832 [Mycena vitilis]|nr:hypothetical protein C8R47DRAFT_1067832 [Mycena vitilis]